MRCLAGAVAVVAGLWAVPAVLAQAPPVIPGVTGTVATPTTIEEEHKAAGKVASKVADGVKKVTGRRGESADDPFSGLYEGLIIGVKQAVSTPDAASAEAAIGRAPSTNEGRVLGIDRRKGVVTLRVAGHVQTYRPEAGAAAPRAGRSAGERVTLLWTDASGQRVERPFVNVP